MSELGASVDLNEDWDFEVAASGDLETAVGLAELEKDVSFNVARNLDDTLGRRVDTATEKRIAIIVEDEMNTESRISAVNDVTVNQIADSNSFEIVADINAEGDSFELVFEVSV